MEQYTNKPINQKNSHTKRIALIYDDLVQVGGGEKFFLNLIKLYPFADVYIPIVSSSNITTVSKLNYSKKLSFFLKFGSFGYKLASLLSIFWFESLKLQNYDVVISLCNRFSNCVITSPATKHICIYTYPARILFDEKNYSLLKSFLRIYLYFSSKRADINISISSFSKKRLKKYLNLNSKILFPFISYAATENISKSNSKDYFLIIGRCNKWKEKYFENAIKTLILHKKNVVVIGKDFLKSRIYLKYKNNRYVNFKGFVPEKDLSMYYSEAVALVHPQVEDFGLTPLESLIYYTPVIAYEKGGVTEFLDKSVCMFYKTKEEFLFCINNIQNFKLDVKKRSDILAMHSAEHYKHSLDLIINQL